MKTYFLHITLIFFFLSFPLEIFSQDAWQGAGQDAGHHALQEEPEADRVLIVLTQTSVRTITAGTPWMLTIFVNHGIPDEVTVVTPQFAPSLILDRIVKTPRMIGAELQTVIDYRFIPESSGRFFIEPFTVTTPHGSTVTERYILDVRGLNAGPQILTPRVIWEDAPRQMAAGERVIISLRITGWDSAGSTLQLDFFMPEIPRGVIMASMPLSSQERSSGIVMKLNLIPLEAGNFILPSRRIQYENAVFNIPALNINITNPAGRAPPHINEQSDLLTSETFTADIIQFSDFNLSALDKNISESQRSQCKNIFNKAKDYWDNGLRAPALAELRRNERYHPVGGLLRQIRQEAEQNLNFYNTENEGRGLQTILIITAFSFLILVIISLFICFFIKRGVFVKRAALVCAVIFTAAGFFCFYRYMDSSALFNKNRFGVTNETPVRRTADYEGEELFRFREGQPVVILLNSGVWVYVRSNDIEGKSGWISSGEVIFY